MAPINLTLAMLAAPTDIAHVEHSTDERGSQITAFDSAGEVSATIVHWADEAGRLHVDADFVDGLYLHISDVGGSNTIESNGAREAAEHAEMVLEYLDPDDVQGDWGSCLWSTVGTVSGVVAVNPWAIAGSVAMACDCLPLLVEEFEGMECPWW